MQDRNTSNTSNEVADLSEKIEEKCHRKDAYDNSSKNDKLMKRRLNIHVKSTSDYDTSSTAKNITEKRKVCEQERASNDDSKVVRLKDFKNKSPKELITLARTLQLKNPSNYNKHDLIFAILKVYAEKNFKIIGEGVLEILSDGYGFLRSTRSNYTPCSDDIYISQNQIRRFGLRTGDSILGLIRAPKKEEKYFAVVSVQTINSQSTDGSKHRVLFEDLTPLYPEEKISLEFLDQTKSTLSGRVIDIIAPLGKGQRALVVAPPRTGKTVLMQSIAHAIAKNYPDINLIVLSIGERPEEVTDMLRSVEGEVVSSTFDEPSHRHVQLAEIVIAKARRLVESKKRCGGFTRFYYKVGQSLQ